MKKRVIIGSGHMYDGGVFTMGMQINDPESYCTEANRFSHVKGGVTLEYNQTKTIESDDMELVKKVVLQTEEPKLKAGLMTLSGAVLKHLIATASDPEAIAAAEGKKAKYKTTFGGIDNDDETPHLWIFHHPDKVDGDIWIVVAGTHNTNANVEFKKDSATVTDLEIDCQPLDDTGRKVYFYEEKKD